MARIKYDINVKPNQFLSGHYLVKFNSEEALNEFVKNAQEKAELATGVKAVRLGEWFAMTDKMNEVLNEMNNNLDWLYGNSTLYTWNTTNWNNY